MPAKKDANSLRLILYLTSVLVLSTLLAASLSKTEIAIWMVVALSTGAALLGLLPLVRRLGQIGALIEAVRRGESIDPIKKLRLDPLARYVDNANGLLGGDNSEALRQDLLEQVEKTAAQQERNRLARELHDSIKQQLFSIQMSAAAAQVRLGENSDDAVEALEDVRKSTQEAMVEMNGLLQQLSPMPLERVGLAQALREQCEALGYRSGAQVTCDIGELPADSQFTPGAQESLFRIAQESLSNVARHARARRVALKLRWDQGQEQVELAISDDGQGFDPRGVEPGRGLANIRERVERLGGWMRLRSAASQGTDLQVGIPLREAEVQRPDEELVVGPAANRAVLIGLGMGVLAAACLSLAWFFYAPLRFAPQWIGVNGLMAAAGYLLAVAVLLLAGWLAGRRARFNAVLEGGTSGLIAALTAYGLVGAAWAALTGSRALLLNGPVFVPDEGEAIRLLVSSAAGIFNMTHALFWGLLLSGTGLGALGGLTAAGWQTPSMPDQWKAGLKNHLLPVLVSSALATLLGIFLLPIVESSSLDALGRYGLDKLPANSIPVHAAVLVCLATPGLFYLGALTIYRRILDDAMPLAPPNRLIDLHWEAFWMSVITGTVGLAALYLGIRYWTEVRMSSPAMLSGQVYSIYLIFGLGLISLGMSFLFAGQLDRLRLKLADTLQPAPSMVEYAGLVGLPVSLILAFLVIIMDGRGWLALGIMLAEAGLLGYGLMLRRKRKQRQKASSPSGREQAAWLSSNWAAYAWGFLIPALAMAASGAGILLLPARLAQYLDIGRLPDLYLPHLDNLGLIQGLFFYTGAAFIGILIVAMVQSGLTLLAQSITMMRARKGL